MDFDVLPGPSLPERARTALARAATATVSDASLPGAPPAAGPAPVPVDAYRAAAPDPLWRVAPGILHHLEHGHMGELVGCVRAHGMTRAEWVIPCGLDRYGLELLVLTTDGIAAVRLAFPDGPVSSLDDVPASLRTALTCRCQAGPGHSQHHGPGAPEGRD